MRTKVQQLVAMSRSSQEDPVLAMVLANLAVEAAAFLRASHEQFEELKKDNVFADILGAICGVSEEVITRDEQLADRNREVVHAQHKLFLHLIGIEDVEVRFITSRDE